MRRPAPPGTRRSEGRRHPLRSVLSAALAGGLLLACGCGEQSADARAPASLCSQTATPIAEIQGTSWRSPLEGRSVVVRGVVTLADPQRGFYLEEDTAPVGRASRALFVAPENLRSPAVGTRVAAAGQVAEIGETRDTLTTLTAARVSPPCATGAERPLTRVQLELKSGQREALEGMRIVVDGPLLVSDVYNAHRGQWTMAAGAVPFSPTETIRPGERAAARARAIRDRELRVQLPTGRNVAVPAGTPVSGVQGVLGHDGRGQRLFLEAPAVQGKPSWPAPPPAADGAVRLVSMNLLNYFNGDGRRGGFPTERGARTPEEFAGQQSRLGAALEQMRPQLLAVQELENDGFGRDSAARSLQELLADRVGGDWAVVDPGFGPIGGDVITVGLFYREDVFEAAGSAATLDSTPFRGLSRQPLAQRFRHLSSGESFWVVVNHLKSKGSCPETGPNRDRDDGQGCWSAARVDAVNALTAWLTQLAAATGDGEFLVVGDMNSLRSEDPVQAFRAAGYLELVEERSGLPQYSYLYFGQRGTLDYAFASPALAPRAAGAFIWHINADMPREVRLPDPWLRASDHDPVVVDLEFSQSSTPD